MLLRCCFFAALVASTLAIDSTFAFARVQNKNTGKFERLCVNHQQYRQNLLPTTPEAAIPVRLSWFTSTVNKTDICDAHPRFFQNTSSLVPIRYKTADHSATCLVNAPINASFMDKQMFYLTQHGVDNVLFLVDKGSPVEVAPDIHKYLFALFYNPELTSDHPNAFYIYYNDFLDKILPLDDRSLLNEDSNIEISFYRPKSWPFDCSEVIILVIALFCIIVGSIWGARIVQGTQLEAMKTLSLPIADRDSSSTTEEGALTSSSTETDEVPPKNTQHVTLFQQVVGVAFAVVFVVAILLIAFFFRDVAVWFFNIFVAIAGTLCIAKCLTTVACFDDPKVLSLSLICCGRFSNNSILGKKFGVFSLFAHILSAAFCLTWFFLRQEYYAFWFLNFINVTLCIVAIKAAQLRNLRILVLLLVGMFIYDIVMVFGSKLITKNGCSVMIQVVTGVDCNQKPVGPSYPIAPLEQAKPEIMPLLFYIPLVNDVMQACYDISVEKEYRHIMLGLGDVIVPGYLIVYCFIVDRLKPTKWFKSYGFITVMGYALGLIATFLALRLMQLAQPALIYLVPFTIIPLVIASWIRGDLKEIWLGKFSNTDM